MKFGLATLLVAAATLGAPAFAQDAGNTAVISVETPSLSETSSAKPDWYRQFTITDGPTNVADETWLTEPTDDTSLVWSKGRRWQLSVDLMSRPATSPLPREEIEAGASFRITPRFSIGGEVSVGANELDDASQWEEQQLEAGIRLKSAYKF